MSVTARLAAFAAQTQTQAIPSEVQARALALTTDFAGSAIRAAQDCDSSAVILRMTERLGLAGEGPCTVLGLPRRYGGAAAALLNGDFGHSLDFDDTHADSSLHPSAPVVPAALAAASTFSMSSFKNGMCGATLTPTGMPASTRVRMVRSRRCGAAARGSSSRVSCGSRLVMVI